MIFEETSRSLFPADLFVQPGDQPPIITEDLTQAMLGLYRGSAFSRMKTQSGKRSIESKN